MFRNAIIGIISIVFLFASASFAIAQEEKPVKDHPRVIEETAEIKTNSQCNMCKKRIEKNLYKTDGVMKAELDVDSQILTVTYNANAISKEDVKKTVSKIGYDADDVKADENAQSQLPKCCQPGGHGK